NPVLGPLCRQEKTLWNVPVMPIKTLAQGDSAVVIYWGERLLQPGERREVGFSYGLGNVAAGEGGGRLAVTTGGSFRPRGEFTLVEGSANQAVPQPRSGATSPVTWKVRAGPSEGTFKVKVQSSDGPVQTQTIRIKERGIFGS